MFLKHVVFIIACVMAIGIFSDAEAQNIAEDVVHLKGGSIIRGIIVQQVPNKSLRIRTQAGIEMTFKMSDVLQITKALPTSEIASFEEKSPMTAVALSFFCFGYGYGQVYNGQYAKAGVHLVVAGACFGIMLNGFEGNEGSIAPGYFGLLIGVGNWAYSIFDAYSSAKKINQQNQQTQLLSLQDNRLFLEPYISRESTGAMLGLRF